MFHKGNPQQPAVTLLKVHGAAGIYVRTFGPLEVIHAHYQFHLLLVMCLNKHTHTSTHIHTQFHLPVLACATWLVITPCSAQQKNKKTLEDSRCLYGLPPPSPYSNPLSPSLSLSHLWPRTHTLLLRLVHIAVKPASDPGRRCTCHCVLQSTTMSQQPKD